MNPASEIVASLDAEKAFNSVGEEIFMASATKFWFWTQFHIMAAPAVLGPNIRTNGILSAPSPLHPGKIVPSLRP